MTIVRYLLNMFVLQPLGSWAMKFKSISYIPVKALDDLFETSKFIPKEKEFSLGQITGLSVPEMKNYIKTKRIERLQKLRLWKYTESWWRFLLYTTTSVYGVCYLWNKNWTWDIKEYWINYPFQQVDPALKLWYFMEFGLYLNFFVFQFIDTKRKDFWEMFVHHLVTLGLIGFSYMTNFTRIGSVVLCLHDVSDIFLEAAKIFNYMKLARPVFGIFCDVTFVIFAFVFFTTRLILFPRQVLYANLVDVLNYIQMHITYYLWGALLLCLQALHAFWFFLICRLIKKSIVDGIEKDERSITESDISDDEKSSKKKK